MKLMYLCLAFALSSCSSAAVPQPQRDPEPPRSRAALAILHVENLYPERVAILYRPANRSAPDVGIGSVQPGATAELAPVPAGEPLILIARTVAGTELHFGPHSFAMDGSWIWRIDREAKFIRPTPAP